MERVAKVIWKETRSASYDWEHETDGGKIIARDRAHAALDASPIGELVEVLQDLLDAWDDKSGMGTVFSMQRVIPSARAKGIGGDNG